MKKETMNYAKREISKVVRITEDEILINKLWNCLNRYFCKHQEDDPRNQVEKLGSEFWESRESEVNMYNVKEKLIENIELIPEEYADELLYLHMLYKLTKSYLIENATRERSL